MNSPPGALHLVVAEGPQQGRGLPLPAGGSIRVGRAEDNELVLADALVSKHHCRITVEGGRLVLEDLGSSNGTLLEGRKIQSAQIGAGQRFRLGSHVLVVSSTPGDPGAGPESTRGIDVSRATGEFPSGECQGCGKRLLIVPGEEGPLLCPSCRLRDGPLVVELRPGGQLGSFRILAELGVGATGTAFRAYDIETGGVHTLKVLRPELAHDETFVERLGREAIALAGLSHPNIVRFHRIGREGPYFYLLLQYVEGTDFKSEIDLGDELAFDRVAEVGREIGRALAYSHCRGVIHRDVKPSNILVVPGGRAMLTDFGLARALDATGFRITETGSSLGSLLFSAPELLDDAKGAGPAADQFCLAATLYYALTREFAFPGRNLVEVIRRMSAGEAAPVRQHRPSTPSALAGALERALSRDPEARFASVGELAAALDP